MKKSFSVLVVVGLVAAFESSGHTQPTAQKAPSLSAMDYVEIEQLYSHYAHYFDIANDDGSKFASLFTDDGVEEVVTPSGSRTTFRGHKELAAFAVRTGQWARHYQLNVMIDPAPEGAHGSAYLVLASAKPDSPMAAQHKDPWPYQELVVRGLYRDTIVRTPAGWKFKQRLVYQPGTWPDFRKEKPKQ